MPLRKKENKHKRIVPKKSQANIRHQDIDAAPKTGVEKRQRVTSLTTAGRKKKPK